MVKGTGIKECLKHAWKNSFLPAGLEAIGEIERKQRKNVFWLNVSKKPLACTMEKVVDEKQNKKWRKNEATRQWSISFFFFFFFLVGCFFGLSILIPDDTTVTYSRHHSVALLILKEGQEIKETDRNGRRKYRQGLTAMDRISNVSVVSFLAKQMKIKQVEKETKYVHSWWSCNQHEAMNDSECVVFF